MDFVEMTYPFIDIDNMAKGVKKNIIRTPPSGKGGRAQEGFKLRRVERVNEEVRSGRTGYLTSSLMRK
jgi:hypothetical protein